MKNKICENCRMMGIEPKNCNHSPSEDKINSKEFFLDTASGGDSPQNHTSIGLVGRPEDTLSSKIRWLTETEVYLKFSDIKDFIQKLKAKATKRKELNFDRKPRKDEEDWAYCGGCNRFVMEEGCFCGYINIKEIDKLAGKQLSGAELGAELT